MLTLTGTGRPGDERGFIHKKIFGAVGSIAGVLSPVIPGAGAISTVARTLAGGGGGTARPPSPGLPWAGAGGGNGRPTTCPRGTYRTGQGTCASPQSAYGVSRFGGQVMEGLYGPAYAPTEETRSIAICPPGFALGKDDLCYAGLANRKRKYPRGRRPLLTGGDMGAISRARSAGNRLANAKSDLIAIGMLKAPGPRRRKKKRVPCA